MNMNEAATGGPSIIRVPSGASPLSAPDSSAHSQGHQVPTRVNVITHPICSHSIPMSPGDSHTTPNLGTREPNVQSGTSQIPGMQGHQSSRASAVPPPASHPPPSRHSGPPNEYKAFGAGECVCSTFMPVSGMKRGLAILHVAQGLCIINVAVEAGFSYSQPRNIHPRLVQRGLLQRELVQSGLVQRRLVPILLRFGLDKLRGPDGELHQKLRLSLKHIKRISNEIMDRDLIVCWDDITGLHQAKQCVNEMVIWPLLRPDIFKGCQSPGRGLLLFGPPRKSKDEHEEVRRLKTQFLPEMEGCDSGNDQVLLIGDP
ncbi:ATPase family AAA domain-containing protein FIGL1 [Artemisia annua]|uniref:ATPase family AAA domain-containing protein FIGL1 n=1 Tax=Artemisia annua TaxID=35608 RepID=A0A2U1N9G1_ARTAN|nr:ATPase family AAA domain-containing protein FIGL1 [Artemisia annua]